MHPQIHLDSPRPLPASAHAARAGARTEQAAGMIRVDESRRARLGIATTKVVTAPIELEIRAEGRLVVDETRLHDVTLKVGGYVSRARGQRDRPAVAQGRRAVRAVQPGALRRAAGVPDRTPEPRRVARDHHRRHCQRFDAWRCDGPGGGDQAQVVGVRRRPAARDRRHRRSRSSASRSARPPPAW